MSRPGQPLLLAGAANVARAVLGSLLLAQWDVRYGVGANTWIDQIGNRAAPGVNSPVFGADGANFRGRSVWKFAAASVQYLDTGALGADIVPTASPNLYVRYTWRGHNTLTTTQGPLYLLNAAANVGVAYMTRGASGWVPAMNPMQHPAQGSDLLVHSWEWGLNAGVYFFRRDRGLVDITSGAGAATTAALRRASIGALSGGVAPADISVAQLLVCSARPSPSQVAALDAADVAAFDIV